MAKLISEDLTNNTLCILEYTTNTRRMLSFKKNPFDGEIVSHTYTDIGKIIFDRPITKIGEKAFYQRCSLTSITIPDNITTIEAGAFNGCINLKEFKGKFAADGGRCLIKDNTIIAYSGASGTTYTIPDSVTSIGDQAFSECIFLTSVTIPDSVRTIGKLAFSGCGRLKSVNIPDSITRISDGVFLSCSSLTSVTIPDSVTTIGEWAFSCCFSLTNINIPNSVTTIGERAFSRCERLKSVNIPDNITRISDGVFLSCSSLTSVTIPDSVTRIGERAFQDCISLTNVTIPNSITIIEDYAFSGCRSLKEFKGKFAVDGGRCLIIYGVLHAFAIGCGVTQYTIPDSVTTIYDYVFSHCNSLTSVTIGNRVKTIGYAAFSDCSSLTSVTIPRSVTYIGDRAFEDCTSLETIICKPTIPPKLKDMAFVGIPSNTTIIIPEGCENDYKKSDWKKVL